MRSHFLCLAFVFAIVMLIAPPTRAATPVSANELDFWVRAGRGTNEILSDVANRGLLEPLDADAQEKLRAHGADPALITRLSGGAYVVSTSAAAQARDAMAALAEREKADRQRALEQLQLAEQARNASAQASGPAAAPGVLDNTAPAAKEGPIEMEAIPEPAGSGADGWRVGFLNARKDAAAENKMVLVDFTGSDWCHWCKKLDDEVFKTPEFKAYAAQKLILVRADFPKHHTVPADVAAQNHQLEEGFRITGYPTVIILDSKGHAVGRLGYTEGGPAVFLAALQKLENK